VSWLIAVGNAETLLGGQSALAKALKDRTELQVELNNLRVMYKQVGAVTYKHIAMQSMVD
jgi:hypothetical protein